MIEVSQFPSIMFLNKLHYINDFTNIITFVHWGHLFFHFLLLPDVKIWKDIAVCSQNTMWNFTRKNWLISFNFIFVKGHFTCKYVEFRIVDGAITFVKYILTASKKSKISLFMKFAQFEEWMLWNILWRFQIRSRLVLFCFCFVQLMAYTLVL